MCAGKAWYGWAVHSTWWGWSSHRRWWTVPSFLSFIFAVWRLTFVPYSRPFITEFMETVKKAEEWTKEGLKEHIIHFIVEIDQVNRSSLYEVTGSWLGLQALSIAEHEAYCELLIYNGCNKTKELHIPHCTQVTECILDCAAEIEADLANELQVSNDELFLQS